MSLEWPLVFDVVWNGARRSEVGGRCVRIIYHGLQGVRLRYAAWRKLVLGAY
jgi:hypothetical protein